MCSIHTHKHMWPRLNYTHKYVYVYIYVYKLLLWKSIFNTFFIFFLLSNGLVSSDSTPTLRRRLLSFNAILCVSCCINEFSTRQNWFGVTNVVQICESTWEYCIYLYICKPYRFEYILLAFNWKKFKISLQFSKFQFIIKLFGCLIK